MKNTLQTYILVLFSCAMVTLSLISDNSIWISLMIMVLITANFCSSTTQLIEKTERHASARFFWGQSITWNVIMNDVQIGTVSDVQHANMLLKASQEHRLNIAQLLNLRVVILSATGKFIAALFLSTISLAILSPESYTKMINVLQRIDLTTFKNITEELILVFSIMFVAVTSMAMKWKVFGFRNHYEEAFNIMLRQHCNTPADGHIQLIPIKCGPQATPTPGQAF